MPRSKYYENYSDDPYPEIREVLGPEYRRLPAEDIETILENANIDPEYMEDFLGNLGKVGRSVVGALPSILPVAGTVVGTAYGGPVGGAIGGKIGSAAGGALGGMQRPSQPPQAPQAPPPGIQAAPQTASTAPQIQGAASAAAQLLQLILQPKVLQALTAMLMGGAGRPNLMVGNTLVPPGAVATTIAELASQAAAEYNAVAPGGDEVPSYLLNKRGEYLCDPAIPEQRAAVLLQRFNEDARQEYWAHDEGYDDYDLEEEDRENNMYDEMDLIELYFENWED